MIRTGRAARRATAALFGAATVAGLALGASTAGATEAGTSFYLLGSGGPEAAILPPVQGLFFVNTVYGYQGDAGSSVSIPLASSVAVGLDAEILADFPTFIWVPSTSFAGGTLAFGAIFPVGNVDVGARTVLTGPGGGTATVKRSDSAFVFGDPVLMGMIGWKSDRLYLTAGTMVNIPIGDYQEDALANLAFNRWAVDTSLALTWHNEESGWDLSTKSGITFNGENEDTGYDSGDEFHFEGSVQKTFSPRWAAGIQGYYFKQMTNDTGGSALLGPFKGEVSAVGVYGSYNFTIAGKPASLRLHAMKEFDATNRLEGSSVFLDFSVPLVMRLPDAAP